MSEPQAPEQKIAPKSLLRHRTIGEQKDVAAPVQEPVFAPTTQRTSRLSKQTGSDSVPIWKRPTATSTAYTGQRRSASPSALPSFPSSRASRTHTSSPTTIQKTRTRGVRLTHYHPLFILGLGMMLMIFVWMLLSTLLGWANTAFDTLRYGNPPTYQADVYVGHNEHPGQPSHFIALNLHRRIEIIEIEGGDPAHTRIYPGPQLYGSQDDVTPVTLSFVTPKGKKYPNMILHIGNAQLTYLIPTCVLKKKMSRMRERKRTAEFLGEGDDPNHASRFASLSRRSQSQSQMGFPSVVSAAVAHHL